MNPSSPSPSTIRVLLADDHPIVMTGFAMALTSFGMQVVGEARSSESAEQMYRLLQPDVLILDIRFGEKMNGLDVAKRILSDQPQAKIIFLSQFDQDSLIKETYRLGGRAFMSKDCDPGELAAAVQMVHAGELHMSARAAERLALLSVRGDSSPGSILEARELEVFILLSRGLTNLEIAERFDVSMKTISNLAHGIKEKLGVSRPAELTRLAVKHGLIEP